MPKNKQTPVTHPALQHAAIVANPVFAAITLKSTMDSSHYDTKTLKTLLLDIQSAFDNIAANSGSNNKNGSFLRQYGEHYQWVIDQLASVNTSSSPSAPSAPSAPSRPSDPSHPNP
ncbi:MAG: hypothetical protein MJZ75_07285 [Paludibacteraceae bacterium]|nr:hypothetical protein [Paludibacteraceae bacterium]